MATPQQKINGLGSMTIGSEIRPFQVNSLNHQEVFTSTLGIALDDYGTALMSMATGGVLTNARTAVAFTYAALVAGCKRTRKEVTFDYQDVLEWIEEGDENDEEQKAEVLKPITLLNEMYQAKKKAEPAAS